MNRRYTHFSQSKISGEPKPPSSPSGSRAAMPGYSTAPWPGAPGPKGRSSITRATSGFKEIAMGAKQDMAGDARIGKKISKLMHEGKEQDQAEAMALNMNREHRLTKEGGYIRKKKKY